MSDRPSVARFYGDLVARDKVYFISDAHLGAPRLTRNHREQEDTLIAFLRSIRDSVDCPKGPLCSEPQK